MARESGEFVFGSPMRKHFPLEPLEAVFANQGGIGVTTKKILEKRISYLRDIESSALTWYATEHKKLWKRNIQLLSEFVGSDPDNLVFVRNDSTGINTVLKSLPFEKGDAILVSTYTHRSVRKTCHLIAPKTGVEIVTVDLRPPFIDAEQIVDSYEKALKDHPNIKLVCLDHICSLPPMLMPLEKLVPMIRKYNALILVDGAHAPGQIKLNLEQFGVDFYTGTLYKWLNVPRASGMLWVNPEFHDVVLPLVTSVYIGTDVSFKDYVWQGAVDFSDVFCVEDALSFLNSIGGQDACQSYCDNLAEEAIRLLEKKLGTKRFQIPPEMESPCMRTIRIPDIPGVEVPQQTPEDPFSVYGKFQVDMELWEKYQIQVAIAFIHGETYLRVSCSIYNTLDEYEKIAESIIDFIKSKANQ